MRVSGVRITNLQFYFNQKFQNMKHVNLILVVLVLFTTTVQSCKKNNLEKKSGVNEIIEALQSSRPGSGGTSENDSTIRNYIIININEHLDQQETENKNTIDIIGSFQDENLQRFSVGEIIVDGKSVPADATNNYKHTYTTEEKQQGMTMAGRDITISLQGSDKINAEQKIIYVPSVLYPGTLYVPYNSISNNQDKRIDWAPDWRNMFGKVVVQVYYQSSMSRFNNPSVPISIASLIYTVNDNGSFTIPGMDLNRFPVGGFVRISVSRASNLTSANTRTRFDYIAVISASTSPLLVTN